MQLGGDSVGNFDQSVDFAAAKRRVQRALQIVLGERRCFR
jgi:hypothetical protein